MKVYHIGLLEDLKTPGTLGINLKPYASGCLWVSLSEHDWLRWISFNAPERIDYNEVSYELELNGNFLPQAELIKYRVDKHPGSLARYFDFDKIREDGYDGFIVSSPRTQEVTGYDIPQCCIWNMKCVKIVNQRKCFSAIEIFHNNLMDELTYGDWKEVGANLFENIDTSEGKKTVEVLFDLSAQEIVLQITTDEKRAKVIKDLNGYDFDPRPYLR